MTLLQGVNYYFPMDTHCWPVGSPCCIVNAVALLATAFG